MKLCRWNELSEEAKKQTLKRYGNEKIEEWILENDSWFDENGFIAVCLKKRKTKMKNFYEVCVTVRENELYYPDDYKVNVKATCIKDAMDGAMMHLYDTAQIYDKEIISIEAHKMEYIEVEED